MYGSWRSSLAESPGRPTRVLAWAPTSEEGMVVLSPAALSISSRDGWRHVGWHEIERGGWNSETAQLHWQTYAGARGAALLPDPGRVPEAFKERIDATVAVERFFPIAAGSDRGVVISGRRDLADGPTTIDWHATLTRGVTWRTPGARELADAAMAELRRGYDEP